MTTDIGYLHQVSAAELALPAGAKVLANIMVASNQATSSGGRSSPLRTPEDGARFHQIRALSKALIIGGNTYRHEPYKKTQLPVYVASKTLAPINSDKLLIAPLSPKELVSIAQESVGTPVLIEGGVNFLRSLIEEKAIDALFITRVLCLGDGDYWNEELLQENFELLQAEEISASKFEIWVPRK